MARIAFLVLLACLGSQILADKPTDGYGPPPAPSYGYAPAPAPTAHLTPIYVQDYEDDYDDDKKSGFGKFIKDVQKGIKYLQGGDDKKKGGPTPAEPQLVAFHAPAPAPHYKPYPKPKPQIVEVQVPKCVPHTHYVTNFVTETVPVPVVQTEFVQNVVPTVFHQTHFQRQLETQYVTDIVTQQQVSTYTKSIAVTRNTFLTETLTNTVTNNVVQRTTEISFTPVMRTQLVTVTVTTTLRENVPQVIVSTAYSTRLVPTTAYVTETKIQLQPSLVVETAIEFKTRTETQLVPKYITKYGAPQIFTTTEYNHVTTSIYEAAKGPAIGIGEITVTQQVKEYIPTVTTFNQYLTSTVYSHNIITQTAYQNQVITETVYKTQYLTKTEYRQTTEVRTDYVTVQGQCGGGLAAAGYGANQPSIPLTPALQPLRQPAAFVASSPQVVQQQQIVATPQLPAPQSIGIRQPVLQNVAVAPTFQSTGVQLPANQAQGLGGGAQGFGGDLGLVGVNIESGIDLGGGGLDLDGGSGLEFGGGAPAFGVGGQGFGVGAPPLGVGGQGFGIGLPGTGAQTGGSAIGLAGSGAAGGINVLDGFGGNRVSVASSPASFGLKVSS